MPFIIIIISLFNPPFFPSFLLFHIHICIEVFSHLPDRGNLSLSVLEQAVCAG